MAVSWTRHRFSGGTLALDTTNTVVHRGDATRSFDRFDDPVEISRFAAAARDFRAAELGTARLRSPTLPPPAKPCWRFARPRTRCFAPPWRRANCIRRRCRLFCVPALTVSTAREAMLRQHASDGHELSMHFEAALAGSALTLLSEHNYRRIKICPNCSWLFLDRSRNGSRLWCDMAVCGNRQKAKRHYRRRKTVEEDFSDV